MVATNCVFLPPSVRVSACVLFKSIDVAKKRPGQIQVSTDAVLEIESEDKPALVCEWIPQFQF